MDTAYPTSRVEALASGAVFYYTGKPCPKGHTDLRYTKAGGCKACVAERSKQWVETNPAQALERNYIWRNNNKAKVQQQNREYYAANAKSKREKAAAYRKANPEKCLASQRASYERHRAKRLAEARAWKRKNADKVRSRTLEWRDRNRNKVRALNAQRKQIIKQRTPVWADKKAIIDFYKNRPYGYEIDHILPLRGDRVSGLHVLENLQYLPSKDNHVKNKHYEP